jgi:hypothetical protein
VLCASSSSSHRGADSFDIQIALFSYIRAVRAFLFRVRPPTPSDGLPQQLSREVTLSSNNELPFFSRETCNSRITQDARPAVLFDLS